MSYAGNFHRLVLIGRAFGEEWNTSLAIAHDSGGTVLEPSAGLIEDVATFIATWYAGASTTDGARLAASHQLLSIKLNRIGPDGRYVDLTSHEWEYPTPIDGGAAVSTIPQHACVISLLTDVSRGPAHRGRMYLPPSSGYSAPDQATGQASVAEATRLAKAGAALVDGINDAYASNFPDFSAMEVVVSSNIGTGTFRRVTSVGAGRVPDVMRSRRSSADEDHQTAPVPA